MVKEIITDLDILADRSDEVDTKKDNALIRQTVLDLKDTIREQGLACLSAPQIGVKIRVFCINFNGDIRSFVNPIITNVKGFELSRETCPSLPGKTFIRPRHNQIDVAYQTPIGKIESNQLAGLAAKVYQKCVDNLDGLLLCDVGLEIDEDFDKASDKEKEEVIKMYLDSLDIRQKQVEKEIEETPELKKTADAIKFMESVQRGETVLKTVKLTPEEIEKKNQAIESL